MENVSPALYQFDYLLLIVGIIGFFSSLLMMKEFIIWG